MQPHPIEKLTETTNRPSVAVVVVTYNRRQLLGELIESLLAQNRPPDAIIVVDNASSDYTAELMVELAHRHPVIEYLRQSHNLGGSGGFHQGVKRAYERGFDWMWLMDDDVRAVPYALDGLLRFTGQAGCIHGRRYDFDGKPFFWQTRFHEKLGIGLPVPGNVFNNGPVFPTNIGVFEGMLISREVVSKIGFPDPRFFITWDDTIYGWLASKVDRVIYVDHYALERRRPQKQINLVIRHLNDASDLYRYHYIRNRPLVKDYLQRHGVYSPAWFAVGSALVWAKEIVRLLAVHRSLKGFGALLKGWKASRRPIPDLPLPASAMQSSQFR
jgi:GT2 family glycosyltransferase